MPIAQDGDKITAALSNGASVTVLLGGATVVSWKSPDDDEKIKERLFVSSKAVLDGSKPVRGGIPIVFPFFGSPTLDEHKIFPSHGFARNEKWTYDGIAFETQDSVSIKFELKPSDEILRKWPVQFILEYYVTLTNHQLGCRFHVRNPDDSGSVIHHQALLHNYIAAPASLVKVTPLNGLTYTDKVKGGVEATEERLEVDVVSETDRVYRSAPGEYEIRWEGGGLKLKTSGFPDVVVWNCGTNAPGDMEENGWERYVCVEPGYVTSFNDLDPGNTWIGTQLFSPLYYK